MGEMVHVGQNAGGAADGFAGFEALFEAAHGAANGLVASANVKPIEHKRRMLGQHARETQRAFHAFDPRLEENAAARKAH